MAFDRRVYLVRHGVTATNKRVGFIGGLEPMLEILPEGREQLEAGAKRLTARDPLILRVNRIHVSATLRARQSAEVFARTSGMEAAIVEDTRLNEISMGEFTGKMRYEVYTPEVIASMNELGENFRAPGGTTRAELGAQMFSWLESQSEPVTVAVSHVNAIRALIHRVLGVHAIDPRAMEAWNGHAAVFDRHGEHKWMFQGLNW